MGLRILSVMMILAGGVWFLQGINIIPGSFMTGQPRWAIIGALTVAAGIGLRVYASRGGHFGQGRKDDKK